MNRFLCEIGGKMREVKKTGQVARQILPSEEISPGICSAVLKLGAVTHFEVNTIVGDGGMYWVLAGELYAIESPTPPGDE